MKRFLIWLGSKLLPNAADSQSEVRQRGRRAARKPAPPEDQPTPEQRVEFSSELEGRIEDGGPGKNVLIRNKYVREDTGTHDTLKIIDDSLLEDETEQQGFDPYNTGRFDRSQSWNLRNRK